MVALFAVSPAFCMQTEQDETLLSDIQRYLENEKNEKLLSDIQRYLKSEKNEELSDIQKYFTRDSELPSDIQKYLKREEGVADWDGCEEVLALADYLNNLYDKKWTYEEALCAACSCSLSKFPFAATPHF